MDWPEAVSLGELDPSKILMVGDEYLHKVADTLSRRKIVNGHAIGRMGQELNVYASAGIRMTMSVSPLKNCWRVCG